MAIPTQAQILAAIIAILNATVPAGRVWNRIRVADDDTKYKAYYVDGNGAGNVWFVRRISLRDETTSFDNIVSATHTYELRYARTIVDLEETETDFASETLFQKQIEDVRAAINADKHLGLDKGTSHTGLQIFQPIQPTAQLGAYTMHLAVAQLEVNVQDC